MVQFWTKVYWALAPYRACPSLTTLLAAGYSHPVLGVGLPGGPFGGSHEIHQRAPMICDVCFKTMKLLTYTLACLCLALGVSVVCLAETFPVLAGGLLLVLMGSLLLSVVEHE
jgi:hypothetical protein